MTQLLPDVFSANEGRPYGGHLAFASNCHSRPGLSRISRISMPWASKIERVVEQLSVRVKG
jgi:hypothetical protein